MPISKTRRVVMLQKKRKKAAGAPAGGGGELMMQTETTEVDPIPVVELFGSKINLCSRWTWEKLLQPVVERIKA